MKIGFVLRPGDSRQTHASYLVVMPYIVHILASF